MKTITILLMSAAGLLLSSCASNTPNSDEMKGMDHGNMDSMSAQDHANMKM